MNEHPITKEALLQGELYAQLLEEELRKARAPRDFEKFIRNVHCTLDRVFVESLAQSGDRIACKAGCSFCCHLKVDALAIEVFSLVEHIGSHLTEKERDLIHAKANANRQRITLMTCEEQQLTKIACPLLSPDGCCMCYVFRPAICRKYHSVDVAPCQAMFERTADKDNRREIVEIIQPTAALAAATIRALTIEGFDATAYDLSCALDEALSNPSCYRRWRAGKSAFPKELIAKDWLQE